MIPLEDLSLRIERLEVAVRALGELVGLLSWSVEQFGRAPVETSRLIQQVANVGKKTAELIEAMR